MSSRGGVVLTGDAAVGVAVGRATLDSGARFVVLGPDGGALDASVAAQAIAGRHPAVGVLVAADTTHDHPYNFARRMLSLDHLTGGRAGILVAPGPSAPVAAAIEFAQIVASLWETFPREAIVTDRTRGRFAESGRIRRLDHTGAWSVAGPLTTPSSVQGRPPIVWLGSLADAQAAGADGLLVVAPGPGISGSRAAAVEPLAPAASPDAGAPPGSLRDLLDLPPAGPAPLPLGAPAFATTRGER